MQMKKKCSGFMLLNALLGITLLAGVIYLIMHTMTKYHVEQNAISIGAELAPIVSALLVADLSGINANDTYPVVTPSSGSKCQHQDKPLVANVALGYLQALSNSGFDLAASACVVISG